MKKNSLALAFAASLFSVSLCFAATEPAKLDEVTVNVKPVAVETQQQDSKKNCVIAADDPSGGRCPACCTNNCSDCSGCTPK